MPVAALGTYAIGTEAIAGEAVHGQPVVVITAPTTNQLVNAALTVTWTYTANPITLLAQGSYRLKLYSSDKSAVFYDTGFVIDAGTTATIPVTYFSDTLTYQVSLVCRPVAPDNKGVDDSYEQFVTVIADFSDVTAYVDLDSVGNVYEIGINGVGYMLADMTDAGIQASMATRRYTRKTVALDSQRFATTSTPFSEAVDRYVFKNFSDFSGGAGQRYLDRPASAPTAFWDSELVNPFTPGKLTVNPTLVATSFGNTSTVKPAGTVFNLTGMLLTGGVNDKTITNLNYSFASATISVAAATTLYDITASGAHWYAAAGAAGVFRNTSLADPGAAWSALTARIVEWVTDRLAIAYPSSGTTPNVFSTLTAAGLEEVPGGRITLPVGWSITSITSGGGKVWFTANTSDRGAVYVWTIGSPSVPTVALEFPFGQRPTSVFAYQGNVFLKVAEWVNLNSTYSKAYIYRCVPANDGTLTPTLVTTVGDSTSTIDQSDGGFTARGNMVFFPWLQMTTTGGTHGVGAIDLVKGGWCKWSVASQASLVKFGDILTFGQSVVWLAATASTSYFHDDHAGTFTYAGFLKTSLIDGNSNLLKLYDSINTSGVLDTSAKTITVDFSTDLATYTTIPAATLTGPNAAADVSWGKRARAVSLKIGLNGFTSATVTYLGSLTVKLHQLGLADQIITMPVLCADEFSDLNKKRVNADCGPGKGSARARTLESLAQTRVKFQDKDWAFTRTSNICEVISVECTEVSVRAPKTAKINEMIVAVVTLRRALR